MKERIKQISNTLNTRVNKVQVTITLLIFTIFLACTGAGWSWFKSVVSGNDTAESYTTTAGNLSITYNGGNQFSASNILPGWTGTKTFTVENTGDSEAEYVINWANIKNTFVNKSDLVMSVSSTNSGGTLSDTALPSTGTHMNIMNGIKIAANTTQTYTINFKYNNRDADQSSDIGKSVSGKIEVMNSKEAYDNYGIESLVPLASTIIGKAPTSTGTINSEGLMKVSQAATGQTPAQTEYRYSGSSVNNYIIFNGETWRIIGVFSTDNGSGTYENRVRIIRDTSIGSQEWNTTSSNDWTIATLNTYLNGDYYNSLTALAKTQIDNAMWYISATGYRNIASAQYTAERASGSKASGGNTNWTGKIALMYPSDYGYASSGCYTGTKTLYDYDDSTCYSSNWMYKSDNTYWMLSPYLDGGIGSLLLNSDGYVSGNSVDSAHAVRPVSNLKSNITVTGGSGTSSDPYTIS